jgi:hypothetical protein
MWVRRTIAGSIGAGLLALTAMTGVAAATGDRPTNVAFVRAWHNDIVHQDGTVAVGVRVRCVPGWEPAELDVSLHQDGVEGDGFTIPTVRCNGHWHKVQFTISDVSGAFHAGAVQISTQFLVTNVESGDSAGAHDQVQGRLRIHG